MKRTIVELYRGPQGYSLVINNYRVVGPKVGGSSKPLKTWNAEIKHLRAAIGDLSGLLDEMQEQEK